MDFAANASIVATLTWQPASGQTLTTDPPPTSPVSILETGTATEGPGPWNGSGPAPYPKGSASDGLGDPQTVSGDGHGYFSSGAHLSQQDGSSGTITIGPVTLSATCPHTTFVNGSPDWEGSSGVNVSLTVSVDTRYATISLPGTTPDTSGKLHILIGQQCQGTLAVTGFPAGTAITNLQWSAAGNTLQGWTGASGGSTATILGAANPYTWSQSDPTQPGPIWYWSDTGGAKMVTCTVTATPPSGQGSAVSVQGSQTVMLDVPTYTEMDTANPTRIDSSYPAVSGPALWAGGNAAQQNGSQWSDSVTITPNLYTGNGDWTHLQIITVSGTHGSTPVPNNGMTGLDGSFPYNVNGDEYVDNGIAHPEGDSPGINLLDTYNNYTLNYSYSLYVMYVPPGNNSIWVPLTKLTWTWSPNVTQPPTGWENWPTGTAPSGNPMVPGAGTRCITEPTWTTKISEH